MTKQTGKFFEPKILRERFSGIFVTENFLGIDETPPALEWSFKAETKLKREILTDIEMETVPLMELSSIAESIHVKIRELSRNTDLDMQEVLGINEVLQVWGWRLPYIF